MCACGGGEGSKNVRDRLVQDKCQPSDIQRKNKENRIPLLGMQNCPRPEIVHREPRVLRHRATGRGNHPVSAAASQHPPDLFLTFLTLRFLQGTRQRGWPLVLIFLNHGVLTPSPVQLPGLGGEGSPTSLNLTLHF